MERGIEMVDLERTKLPVALEADVVVIGAGPAGFGAATRSARNGFSTVIIERFGSPGGNMTNGFMCATTVDRGGLHTEFNQRLRSGDHLFDAYQAYPDLEVGPPRSVFAPGNPAVRRAGRFNFTPEVGAYLMNEIMEESNVRLLFRTTFIDAIVRENISAGATIEAVIVENASGIQAIKGKVFIDATGAANVVARAGLPFKSPGGDATGWPIPGSLMWKMSGVNYERLLEYQKSDPKLERKIAEARTNGDIPDKLYRPRPENVYASQFKGHPHFDMCPLRGPDMLLWEDIPYEWALNLAESGEDMSRADVEMRKLIFAEWKFLKKYVPGFETSYISGIAPMTALRDGRHPEGEYTITHEDIISNRRFPDAVLQRTGADPLDFAKEPRQFTFDVPYRAFLPKKVNNLLLSGDCLSFTHECRVNVMRGIPWSILTGEVAGTAASLSVKHGVTPKQFKWTERLY